MLSCLCRLVAPSVRARLIRIAMPLASAWMLAAPVAHAVETMAMPMEKSMAASSPALDTYQKWRDEPIQDWTASNDRVGEIGGWLTYLRDAQKTEDGAGPAGHGHHDHHGH